MGLFSKKNLYKGTIVDLKEKYRTNKDTSFDGVPCVYYDILRHEDSERVGSIDLRMSVEGDMLYYGNVGYRIMKMYRGHHYAYEACKLLFEIAREEFKMKELILTCSPENIASYRTLKKLNGQMLDLIKVPKDHPLFREGKTRKYIFRYKIEL